MAKSTASFPVSLDTAALSTDRASGDTITSISYDIVEHAIYQLEQKVGVDSSAIASSHDYLFTHLPTQVADLDMGSHYINWVGSSAGFKANSIEVASAGSSGVWKFLGDLYATANKVGVIKTGTYTGNGSTTQNITGLGFQPKYVSIWRHPTGNTTTERGAYTKLDQTWGDYVWYSGTTSTYWDNCINSLDADGFTVDDGAANADPNADTLVYDYLALG